MAPSPGWPPADRVRDGASSAYGHGWGGGPVVRGRESRLHGEGSTGFTHAMELQGTEALVITGEPWPDPYEAERRVRRMQTKLHHWAANDPGRRFDDLFNLIYDPDSLTVAWERVRTNKGGRTPGIDLVIPAFISDDADVVAFLNDTREQLKSRTFTPLPVRERMIPKSGKQGQFRRVAIPTDPANHEVPHSA